jgi:hypothetical protein
VTVALVENTIWVAHANGEIRALSREGALLLSLATDSSPIGLASDGARVWAAHRAGIVTQIEAAAGTITA